MVHFQSDYSVAHNGFRLEWAVHGCGGRLTKPEGVIASPNYPNVYPNSIVCVWHVDQVLGSSIELNITDFYLEATGGGSDCSYDSLTVWGGQDRSAPRLSQLCNRRVSNTVVTALGNNMLIEFKTDSSVQGKGFTATYRRKEEGCGGKVRGASGVITSPNYPENYNQNDDCGWLLEVDSTHVVQFQFEDFDVEPHSNCSYDYVALYDGSSTDSPLLLLHCGKNLPDPPVIRSSGSQMFVRMKADGSVASKGFKANFTKGCGATLITEGEGVLTSPDFPQSWIGGDSCDWVIQGPRGEDRVSLQITMLDLPGESLSNCSTGHGYLEVRDGPEADAPLISRYCGHSLPQDITSHGSSLRVTLHRGDSFGFTHRFRAVYRVATSGCGGELTSESGRFASPGYPESPPPGSSCEWTISASPGNLVSLTLEELDLEDSEHCNVAYVDVYAEGPHGVHIGRYCGNSLPSNITTANSLWVKFSAGDSETASQRFLASYTLLHSNRLSGVSGQLASPHYPLHMFSELFSYQWTITVEQGKAVEITFEDLDLEVAHNCYSSRLSVYDGPDDTGHQVYSGCTAPGDGRIQSASNMVFITFTGEYLIYGAKFLLSWRAVPRVRGLLPTLDPEGCGGDIELDARGNITLLRSPGWPSSYAHNLNCEWLIRAPANMRVQLAMQVVRLEYSRWCRLDRLTVYDGMYGTERWNKTGDYCSRRDTRVLFSSGSVMKAVFKTDHSISSRGFQASLRAVCGGYIPGVGSGVITSPGYPHHYPPNSDCQWVVRTSPAKTLEFIFTSLDVSSVGTECSEDYIILRNGGRPTSPLFLINPSQAAEQNGHLCGSTIPQTQNTSSNHLSVSFHSDQTTAGRGFRLQWRELSNGCGGTVRLTEQAEQIIQSPHYPNSPPQVLTSFLITKLSWFVRTPSASGPFLHLLDKESTWMWTDLMSRVLTGQPIHFVNLLLVPQVLSFRPGVEKRGHRTQPRNRWGVGVGGLGDLSTGIFCGDAPHTQETQDNVMYVR